MKCSTASSKTSALHPDSMPRPPLPPPIPSFDPSSPEVLNRRLAMIHTVLASVERALIDVCVKSATVQSQLDEMLATLAAMQVAAAKPPVEA